MSLVVFTACLKRTDLADEPDFLDITRGGGGPAGAPFAPTWKLLGPALAKIRQGGAAAAQGWAEYEPRYIAEMRVSAGMSASRYGDLEREAVDHGVRPCREAWRALLARGRVVLGCHCRVSPEPGWCHRYLLGRTILPALGATYAGELPAATRQGRLPGLE